MPTIDEDIQRLKGLEQEYKEIIESMHEHYAANFGLIQETQRKLNRIKLARLDLESRGLVK